MTHAHTQYQQKQTKEYSLKSWKCARHSDQENRWENGLLVLIILACFKIWSGMTLDSWSSTRQSHSLGCGRPSHHSLSHTNTAKTKSHTPPGLWERNNIKRSSPLSWATALRGSHDEKFPRGVTRQLNENLVQFTHFQTHTLTQSTNVSTEMNTNKKRHIRADGSDEVGEGRKNQIVKF